MNFSLYRFIFFILISLPIRMLGVEVNTLEIQLKDGTVIPIPIYGEVSVTKDNENLFCVSHNQYFEIPLDDIYFFSKGKIEIEESKVVDVTDKNSGSNWYIYDMEGNILGRGKGIPDFDFLPKGKMVIVKQGNLIYKTILH